MLEHDTTVGRARIHWAEDGAGGVPFVLVPGWGSSVIKWRDVLPMLATQRRTIALDLPGFGRSSAPRGSYSPAWFAGAIRAFLDAIDVERAVVVGNSLGGLAALWFASAWPERAQAYVGVAPVLPNEGPQPSRRVVMSMAMPLIPGVGEYGYKRYLMSRSPERMVAEGLQRNCVDPARVSAATVRALEEEARWKRAHPEHLVPVLASQRQMMWAITGMRNRTWSVARALRVPSLLVWGENDRMLPVHIGERAVREIPGSELVVIPDCGHNPQMEKPEEFAAIVLSFAERLARA